MKLFYPLQRTTLHIPGTGPKHDRERGHLHIVLNDPCPNKKNLLVSICSWHQRGDGTCILTSGHKFIRGKSYVSYFHADVVDTDATPNARLMYCIMHHSASEFA